MTEEKWEPKPVGSAPVVRAVMWSDDGEEEVWGVSVAPPGSGTVFTVPSELLEGIGEANE